MQTRENPAPWDRAASEGDDVRCVGNELANLLARGHVENVYVSILGAQDHRLRIGREKRRADAVRDLVRDLDAITRDHLPDSHILVVAAGEDQLPVPRDVRGPYPFPVAVERPNELAGGGVPELHGPVEARGEEGLAVRSEECALDVSAVARALDAFGVNLEKQPPPFPAPVLGQTAEDEFLRPAVLPDAKLLAGEVYACEIRLASLVFGPRIGCARRRGGDGPRARPAPGRVATLPLA